MKRTGIALLAVTLASAAELPGQALRETALRGLPSGASVRVQTPTGQRFVASVVSTDRDSLVVAVDGARRTLGAGAIDSLWIRERATVTGAAVGGAVGAVGSIVIAALVCHSIREDFPCGESGTAIAASVIGGVVVGGAIGSAIPRWTLRYARGSQTGWNVPLRPRWRLGIALPLP